MVADTEIDNIILTEGPEINGIANEEIALDNFIVANIDNPQIQLPDFPPIEIIDFPQ
ncbi:MAG: hypothetical protein F6K22_37825 [Okeania sp. SIO2F4]|uniref:hypothetical protein n=1 Tax=Okeania sp. SIO2F4 TaxID=2607790 RepID=UPI00142B9C1A|nr:hypothetical protein [Okeania sp. SIO2F4]NES08039.1 hypothetical protein [Okeania sp. SIO2F4]